MKMGMRIALVLLFALLAGGCGTPSRVELCKLPEYPTVEKFDNRTTCFEQGRQTSPMAMLIYKKLAKDGYGLLDLNAFSPVAEREMIDCVITFKGAYAREVAWGEEGGKAREFFAIVEVQPASEFRKEDASQRKSYWFKCVYRLFYKEAAEIHPAAVGEKLIDNLFNTPGFREALAPQAMVADEAK